MLLQLGHLDQENEDTRMLFDSLFVNFITKFGTHFIKSAQMGSRKAKLTR